MTSTGKSQENTKLHRKEENVPKMQIKMHQGTDLKKKSVSLNRNDFMVLNIFIPSAAKEKNFELTKDQMYFFNYDWR